MSSYRDPVPTGDVHPSEEEIDPTGVGLEPTSGTSRRPGVPEAHSVVTHHPDGSVEIVVDLDGDGIPDVVQLDLNGDGVPDITFLDSDGDGRWEAVVREPEVGLHPQ